MGMNFPAGEAMDKLAENARKGTNLLTRIKVKDGWLNLSGIDTQIKNRLNSLAEEDYTRESLAREIFERLSDAVISMVIQVCERTRMKDVLMAGGVSSSTFMRKRIEKELKANNITVWFDNQGLSSDNAVGIALLGGKYIWH